MEDNYLTLGVHALEGLRYSFSLCVCLSFCLPVCLPVCLLVRNLPLKYIVYTSKIRYHIEFFVVLSRFLSCGFG